MSMNRRRLSACPNAPECTERGAKTPAQPTGRHPALPISCRVMPDLVPAHRWHGPSAGDQSVVVALGSVHRSAEFGQCGGRRQCVAAVRRYACRYPGRPAPPRCCRADSRLIHQPSPDRRKARSAGQLFITEQHSQPISDCPGLVVSAHPRYATVQQSWRTGTPTTSSCWTAEPRTTLGRAGKQTQQVGPLGQCNLQLSKAHPAQRTPGRQFDERVEPALLGRRQIQRKNQCPAQQRTPLRNSRSEQIPDLTLLGGLPSLAGRLHLRHPLASPRRG